MHVLLWDLRAADCLSNNELLHLKRYATGFLYRQQKNIMILSQEFHGLYPADSEIFRVNNNNKTRLVAEYQFVLSGLFWKLYAKRWWWNMVSVKSKTWMVTESNHFLSLIFNFLACVYVCVCVFVYFIHVSIFLSLIYYLSLLSLLFILFWYCFYSFCWKHQDSNYRKFRKRESWNNKDKTKIK